MSDHAHDIAQLASQRQDQRIAVCAAGTLRFGEGEGEGANCACELLNISAGGAMVRAELPEAAVTAPVLDLPGVGRFPGRLAWRHNQFVGLAFDEKIEDMEEIVRAISIAVRGSDEKRRAKRTSVLWRGRLYAGGRTHEVRVLNISPGGAKLRGPALAGNTPVMLTVDRAAEVPARVVWSDHDQIGIRFLDQPHEICEVFGDLLPALRAGQRGDADREPR